MLFDKGVGICVMKRSTYHEKMKAIIDLPQFKKVINRRKNAKHTVFKEGERVNKILKTLQEEEKLSEALYKSMKARGSQPARLYGLAKVHKRTLQLDPCYQCRGLHTTRWQFRWLSGYL